MALRFPTLIVLVVLIVLTGCGPELAARPADPATPTPVPTRPPYEPDDLHSVERRDLLDSVTGRATVEPKLTDELFFRRDGRIGVVEVGTGDTVQEGDVLARLEQADLEYQIGLASIDVDLAELREREARERRATAVELVIAAKEVERAQLALERLETEQRSLEIVAPYAGRISKMEAKPGAEIDAYRPVGQIVGTEELIVVAEFTGAGANRIRVGQAVDLADPFDKSLAFTGTIAGQAEGSGRFVVEPGAGAPKLTLGGLLHVTAVLGRAEAVLTVPSSVVKTIGERRYVLLVDNGELRRVFVETGIQTDGVAEIRSGLQEGQQVSER